MIAAIHQPHYLPWLRYVDKIARSDVFVLLDDAQFTKHGWQNRNKIKSAQGWIYLTVPVLDPFGKPILEVRINTADRWRVKHRQALRTNYSRASSYRDCAGVIDEIYDRPWELLAELNAAMLERILGLMGISTPVVRSSQLGVGGRGTERLVAICRRLGATTYLTGDFAASNHLDAALFADAGIAVRAQGWRCEVYRQQFPQAGFIPDLSVLDLLFNEGPASAAVLARSRALELVPV